MAAYEEKETRAWRLAHMTKKKGGGESYSPVKDAAVSLSRAYVIKWSRRCRMVYDERNEAFVAAFTKRLKLPRRISAEPMSEWLSDAMDKVKGGVSYPPNLADAKEETPNGQKRHTMPDNRGKKKRGSWDCRVYLKVGRMDKKL